jgi:hypothetical protein
MLSERKAYEAMYAFLVRRYEFTKSDDLGALLGDMSLMANERPTDAALWGDWMDAIKAAEAGEVDPYVRLKT